MRLHSPILAAAEAVEALLPDPNNLLDVEEEPPELLLNAEALSSDSESDFDMSDNITTRDGWWTINLKSKDKQMIPFSMQIMKPHGCPVTWYMHYDKLDEELDNY